MFAGRCRTCLDHVVRLLRPCAVDAAVEEYIAWQSGKLGRDINPDKLRDLLFHTGVKRIVLRSPAYKVLEGGKNNAAPQIAKLGTKTIVNGGYEDE